MSICELRLYFYPIARDKTSPVSQGKDGGRILLKEMSVIISNKADSEKIRKDSKKIG